jgi:hypothetical protein
VGSVRFRLPSPSMAVALLALFVALGGSSYAALKVSSKQIVNNSVRSKDLRNNDVRSADVRNNSLTGADINETRVGTVPRATSAATATSATNATTAATADNTNALGGIAPAGYVQTPTEATRLVGTPGNPPFEAGFANTGQGAPAGFFKDQFGIVHLQGDIDPPGFASAMFTLPAGYRPTHDGATGPQFGVRADATIGVVDVRFDGQVRILSSFNNSVSINGVTFRAAG